MKAVIELDVPGWQIGQPVSVYFPDTMQKKGTCELLKEQEAKPVEVCGQMFTIKYGHCPTCGKGMDSDTYPHWCGFCGQAVKWS